MARKKVTLQWIANDSTRRATFKKRRKGLMKKASELATLCAVDACVVVYGEGESQPEVWPGVAEAARVLDRFKAMPELDQCKKMMDMEGFLRQRVDKLREQLHRAQRENRERETTLLLHDAIAGRRPGLAGLSAEEIASLGWMVENRLQGVRDAMERLQQGSSGQQQQQDAPATALQLQLQPSPPPPQVPLQMVPAYYGTGAGAGAHRDDVHPPHGWLMEVARAGGDLGALVYSGFGGDGARGGFGGAVAACTSTSTSAGVDMLPQLAGNFNIMGAGFAWPDAAQPFSSM